MSCMGATSPTKTFTYVGNGVYSVPEAARLTGIQPGRIRRWTKGYDFRKRDRSRSQSSALFAGSYRDVGGKPGLSFLDLIEIRFVEAFRSYGVSLQAIRIAAHRAAIELNVEHPFATSRFYTDRHRIFLRAAEQDQNVELIDLVGNQYAIDEILTPHLIEGMEFSASDLAERWWPLGKQKDVLIDPNRRFGQPVIGSVNIPTVILAGAYEANGSYEAVAEWMEVDELAVRLAVEFEKSLA